MGGGREPGLGQASVGGRRYFGTFAFTPTAVDAGSVLYCRRDGVTVVVIVWCALRRDRLQV